MNPKEFRITIDEDGNIISEDSKGNKIQYDQSQVNMFSSIFDVMKEHGKTIEFQKELELA